MHAAKIASPSPSLSPTFVSIYIFNVIVVNRSPSDPKRATYNRIVFIWDPWMLRSSEEDRERENWENSLLLVRRMRVFVFSGGRRGRLACLASIDHDGDDDDGVGFE